jgi:hypothetical protein
MLSRPAAVNIRLGSEPTDMRQGSTRSPTSSTPPRPSTRSQGHPLIFRSRRGGGTAMVLYSSTGTRKRHDIDPLADLRDVLPRLPAHPADRLDERLPDVRFASHPSARRETAARAGVEVKPGSQPVVRRANPRPPHSETAGGCILGVLFRSPGRPRPSQAGASSLRRRPRSRRGRMNLGRTRYEPGHPHPRGDRAGRPEGHRSSSWRRPIFPNRPRVPRPTAPPGWSKRHQPCPAIAPARM